MSRNIISFSFLFFSLFAGLVQAQSAESPSFGELAVTRINSAMADLAKEGVKVQPEILPHEAKTLRKAAGQLRAMLDIFVYALPASKGDEDFFVTWRALLDQGYEQVGFFKDLYDAQGVSSPAEAKYDAADVKKLRKPLLKWHDAYFDKDFQAKIQKFLKNFDADHVGNRKAKVSSKFYWRNIETHPAFDDAADASLLSLINGLLELARAEEAVCLGVSDVIKTDDIETFHDFRKRIRALVDVADFFPKVLNLNPTSLDRLKTMDELVDRYGSLHDKINAYESAVAKGKVDEAKALADTIQTEWNTLKEWQKKTVVLEL